MRFLNGQSLKRNVLLQQGSGIGDLQKKNAILHGAEHGCETLPDDEGEKLRNEKTLVSVLAQGVTNAEQLGGNLGGNL